MKPKDKGNLTIRIIKYGLDHESFTLKEMYDELGINTNPSLEYIQEILAAKNEQPNPNNILGLLKRGYYHTGGLIDANNSVYALLPTAYFSYTDLQEIQLARENAEFAKANAIQANRQSQKAYNLSVAAVIISALLGILQLILQK
jgi:hypothetical protein